MPRWFLCALLALTVSAQAADDAEQRDRFVPLERTYRVIFAVGREM